MVSILMGLINNNKTDNRRTEELKKCEFDLTHDGD